MPDLHSWINQKIEAAEERARQASAWGADWYHDDCVNEVRDYGNGNTIAVVFLDQYADQIISQDPAAVLRRCNADRKILDIHRYAGGTSWDQYACHGCGYDDTGYLVDHSNDCETLQALAEGYGITDDQLARLDRPEWQRPVNLFKSRADEMDAYSRYLDRLMRPTNPTSAVPAALRGPNWKARP